MSNKPDSMCRVTAINRVFVPFEVSPGVFHLITKDITVTTIQMIDGTPVERTETVNPQSHEMAVLIHLLRTMDVERSDLNLS